MLPEKIQFDMQLIMVRSRYKFLVLCGKSGTGKTWFSKYSTGDPAECLGVNCANCPEPDLRAFDPLRHKAVLFDEASPAMVIAPKTHSQYPSVEVSLGMSTTNCHAYNIFVSGGKLVIRSNTWMEDVPRMDKEADREWLSVNSFVASVGSTRVWIE